MLGLTSLGIVHTAISLVAVGAGIISLIRDKGISLRTRVGQVYVVTTVLTCLTGFPIVQHVFGAPHILGIITLIVLAIAAKAGRNGFGKASRYVEVVCYSATFFFHWIPAITETTTRFPLGAPLIANRDGPELQAAAGVLFLLFVIGAGLQVRALRTSTR